MSEIQVGWKVDWEAEREARASQAGIFPELHIPEQGGTARPQALVDLAPLWERAVGLRHERARERSEREDGVTYVARPDDPTVDMLAEEAGGLALRLRAGLTSLANRRDGSVHVEDRVEGDAITITMWSHQGNWSDRGWWAQTTAYVTQDEYGAVFMPAPTAEFIVRTGDRSFPRGENPFTEYTHFTDSHERACVVGGRIVAAWMAWTAREQVRYLLAHQADPELAAVTAQEFMQGPAAS